MHRLLLNWDKSGGSKESSSENQAILNVFEQANTPVEVRSTFTNMMMTAFLRKYTGSVGMAFY